MISERFWQLISRRLAGEATIHEIEELERMVQQNSALNALVKQHLQAGSPAGEGDADAEAALAAHMVKMQLSGRLPIGDSATETPAPSKTLTRRLRLVTAAMAVVLLGTASLAYLRSGFLHAKPGGSKNEIATERGAASRIILPDSTEVWLNGDSRLTYPESFVGNLREVTLSGEAFFNVAKDKNRPFVIHTDKIDVRVLGTAFNLKSYPNDERVETALIHGKIEVTFKDRPFEKIILHPNEKLTVRKNQREHSEEALSPKVEINSMTFLKDSLLPETAWMQNKIVFADEPFSEIAKLLERRFDVQFHFKDEQIKEFRYTGSFENESIQKILELLNLSRNFSYSIKGKNVVVG